MADRFELLFQLPWNLHSSGSPVILLGGSLLKDTQSKKVLIQLKFKNISAHHVKALKVQIVTFDATGEKIHGMKEYQYLDLSVSSGGVFGSNKAIVLRNTETRSFQIESLSVVLDNSICSVNMPLRALPDAESLEKVLKHPELIKQFHLEINEKALFAPQEIQDTWRCSCGEWNGTENCSNCGVNREYLFSIYDPSILISKTTVRLRKEKAEQEELEKQKRKAAEEEARKTAIQNNNQEYIYCEQCGAKIKDGVKFCRYCGAKITDSHMREVKISEQNKKEVAKPITPTKQKQKSKAKRFIQIVALVPIYLILAYGSFTFTTKLLADNTASNQGIVKTESTQLDQATNAKSPIITTMPTESKENIDHMVSFMEGYNFMTYDFNTAADTNYPLIKLDDIRSGHFKTSTWGSFDMYMSEDNDIVKVVYCAMMDDFLENEDNFYEMACNIAAIMHGMDSELTETQRKEYTGGILSFDFTDGSVYSKTYNDVTYEMDIAYGMSFRLVATRK